MRTLSLVLLLLCSLGSAFVPTGGPPVTSLVVYCSKQQSPSIISSPRQSQQTIVASGFGLLTTATALLVPAASVAATEVELADLPPAWIPAAFGVALIVGVGVLTSSLGDVIDEESQLGMQSGARARKEIERSKSSYFKKK